MTTARTGLAALLPEQVTVVQLDHDVTEQVLLPAEEAVIANAVPKRRAEFATVRHCARQALTALGAPAVAILPGPQREPLWPAGVVGSLTHCEGYRAAAVARQERTASIGIDAEIHDELPEGVEELVTVAGDRERLARLAAEQPDIHWGRLLFSAKESIYKAWFPLTGAWLDFTDCALHVDPVRRTFTGRLLVPGPSVDGHRLDGFQGRWSIHGGHILTAVHVPRSG